MQGKMLKPIQGYEKEYLISDCGEVYSTRSQKWLKPAENEKGYLRVCLQKDGVKQWLRVNRLVAQAFIPNPDGKATVNHINGLRNDNRAENLEWATMTEQNGDPRRRSNMSASMKNCEYVQSKRRAVIQKTLEGEIIRVHESLQEAARYIKSTAGNIFACCSGARKSCKGYSFEYAAEVMNDARI